MTLYADSQVLSMSEEEGSEEEATNHDYFLQFSVDGDAFGVNTLVYAMTH